MKLLDTISIAFRTIRGNKLRTGITVAIIAFGIMALVGIITAIEAMNASLRESFATMGANAFSIRFRERQMRFSSDAIEKKDKRKLKEKKSNMGRMITYQQAREFKSRFEFPGSKTSVGVFGGGGYTVKFENLKTNPQVRVQGGDENYLELNGYEIESGRNFNNLDVESGRSVCVLGHDISEKLFGTKSERAIEKIVSVNGDRYRVIGVTKSKGSSALMRADAVVFATYKNVRRVFVTENNSFYIGVMVPDMRQMDAAIGEAESTFRPIRNLNTTEASNFYIDKSDSLAETFIKLLSTISSAAGAIGLITLIGAAIGLMNIMLVAVSERTKEVGLIKAIGGTKSNVRRQFLFESLIISLLGALFGIIAGVLVGNLVGSLMDTGFFVPWRWVTYGILICSAVGLVAGVYPAWKASKLDPIVALRYE